MRINIFGSLPPSYTGSGEVAATDEKLAGCRHRILDAAVKIATEGGYHAVVIDQVARRAEVPRTTVELLFPSPVHILVSALSAELHVFDDRLQSALGTVGDPFGRLRVALSRLIGAMESSGHITEAMTHAYAASHAVATEGAQTVRDQTSVSWADVMGAGRPTDEHRQVAEVMADIWTAEVVALVQDRISLDDLRRQCSEAIDLMASRRH